MAIEMLKEIIKTEKVMKNMFFEFQKFFIFLYLKLIIGKLKIAISKVYLIL